jgi:beta-galactosidase GanA
MAEEGRIRRLKVRFAPLLIAAVASLGSPALARAAAPATSAQPGAAQGPTGVTATAGSSSATVRWSAPATVDGAPVSSFTVTASTGQTMTAAEPNTWAIVPGLSDGQPVTFTVTATSSAGTSAPSAPSAPVTPEPIAPPRNVLRGVPEPVRYDQYSVIVGGRRVLIWAGEFDYYRLPSPSLWVDRLEEMKAAGFNAVSIYFDWDYHSPAPGVYDFSGIRDINRLLNDAQRVGLYVIARPGPYINAETDAGGLAGWLASEPVGSRTNDPQYLAAADQWLSEVDPIIAAHQITRGGDVILYQIENEYGYTDPTGEAYFGNLEAQAKADGIDVPTYTNDVGSYANGWAPGTPDAPDLMGSDQYPEGFDCTDTNVFSSPPVLTGDHEPGIPLTVPEYQGGSFDSWGGAGYPACAQLTGPDFENAFYKYYIAQGATMQSIYMTVGGTNWGFNPAPFMYTSYDYGSPISEPGTLSFKYPELKLVGEMSQALPDLAETDQLTPPPIPGLTTFEERNPSTGATFLYLGNDGSSPVTASLPYDSSATITVPAHQAKFLVSDARVGGQYLTSTTSELVTQMTSSRGSAVALMDGDSGARGETSLSYSHRPSVRVLANPSGAPIRVHWNRSTHVLRLGYLQNGLSEVAIDSGRSRLLLLLADSDTAARFWVEHTSGGPLLVYGGELLRTAAVRAGRAVLTGDTSAAGPLRVWAPAGRVEGLSWDGVALSSHRGSDGSLSAGLPGAPSSVSLPSLDRGWRFEFGSAERLPGFDDSSWPVADHQVTDNPTQPTSSPVLYAQDYGFEHGFVWYRGHFTATGSETGVTLTADTGPFGSFAVWINGVYVGSASTPTSTHPFANMTDNPVTQTFTFPGGSVKPGQDNVIAVLTENMGQDESFENSLSLDSDKTPRGLENASLTVSTGSAPAVTWRLMGASAAQAERDPVRGPTNPAGLGESNAGWALPGYPDASWTRVSLPDSWAARNVPPGVGWYRTTFSLHLPPDVWAPLGLRLTPPGGGAAGPGPGKAPFQALIYLNGWLIGRYINDLGPQSTFYLPQGLLRTDGQNTLAIGEWSLAGGAGGLGQVSLVPYEVLRGGIPVQDVPSPGY